MAAFNDQNPEEIVNRYKQMNAECQQISAKLQELTLEKDEHRLVIDTLSKLEPERKAFRLVGGVLVERTVGEVLPTVTRNAEGIAQITETLENNLKTKDAETKAFKAKYGIMTQTEREAMMRRQQKQQAS
eukprot:CAMPEP_0185024038 /NCGR_PEP_ID=MMETSP1103-20130426/6930_1 /TAXON_ID=36769 /ORGANISM="Paraphysomonas bandaiensis, Strain Caron Lab Isolate" /LENGTH=129 /DNA_ID=CAMNT_0027556881 /DNA_START=62 /DNA_END=451 /DNA_ORIENTATION=+